MLIKGCKAASKMLFTGTMTLGCKSYQDAQKRACFCPPVNTHNQNQNQNQNQNPNQQKNGKDRDKYNGKKPKDKRNYGWKSNDEVWALE